LEAVQALNDENIIRINSTFNLNDDRWANATVEIMPYYSSGSLADMIKANGPKSFQEDFLLECAKSVTKALVTLHKNNIVHRYEGELAVFFCFC